MLENVIEQHPTQAGNSLVGECVAEGKLQNKRGRQIAEKGKGKGKEKEKVKVRKSIDLILIDEPDKLSILTLSALCRCSLLFVLVSVCV